MKILFAVSNENIAEAIKKQYQNDYKGILTTKNVYYFNAIIKELQNDKTYDIVIISEDLEPFANSNYDAIDKFLVGKLTDIREESKKIDGTNLTIIFITTDRHSPGDNLLSKLYEIGIYNALFGENRSVHKVCDLIAKPRNMERAKADYKIVGEAKVEESGDNVKESEIKNIIAHYKKLGKSEEKYVESFDNIASQYSDAQLKVIIRFLPLNVKAVLEEQSPKYQELMTFGVSPKKAGNELKQLGKIHEQEKRLEQKQDILLEQLSDIKTDSQIVIPKAINPSLARKSIVSPVQDDEYEEINVNKEDANKETYNIEEKKIDEENDEDDIVKPVKRGRGRPKKVKTEEELIQEAIPKKRGRPKKIQTEENVVPETPKKRGRPRKTQQPIEQENDVKDEDIELPGLEDEKNIDMVEPTKKQEESMSLFDIEEQEEQEEQVLPGVEIEDDETEVMDEPEEYTKSDFNNNQQEKYMLDNEEDNVQQTRERIFSRELLKSNNNEYQYQNIEHLVSRDRKIVSFIGTGKNGTSFIVNNVAQILSDMGINTVILDMTKNRNSYYIYTQNDENLRQRAHTSIDKLRDGIIEGIVVNKNLTVYTATPTDSEKYEEADLILKTLIQNYSLVLVDCDFNTPLGYIDNSQELYLVQSMDILTIQPLTAYLRDLKTKGILKQEKIRVIVNKAEKIRGLNDKVIVGGVAKYNDPSMSFMTELFDKNLVPTCVIPFDLSVYVKYLGTLVDCELSLSGYPKQFVNKLKELANMIYPLIANNSRSGYMPPSLNKFQSAMPFGKKNN